MSTVRDVVEVVARALTDRPDDVKVIETEHKGTTLVELYVGAGELGRVIGKQGVPRDADARGEAAEQGRKTVT